MNEINMDQMLVQMRAMAEKAQGAQASVGMDGSTSTFSELLNTSINKVNELQKQGGETAQRFELGDPDVNLADVMINLQKANISFQAMTQVRNRLVSAYQEIMNMSV